MVQVKLAQVEKTFQTKNGQNPVLVGIELTIAQGEVIALRGDNGCGKTTLLNILAGIERPTSGTVLFDGMSSESLRIGYVQQDYTSSLLPWFDVLENIAIPLRLNGVSAAERRERAEKLLNSLGFDNVPRSAYPHQLSGGQKQKVAVARALISDPHLLLLDEPFANLDAHTSRDLQETLSRMHDSRRPTVIYVSHELDHSIYLADRIVLLHGSPARIVLEFSVPLQRPRKREVMLRSEFGDVRSQIFREEESLYAKRL